MLVVLMVCLVTGPALADEGDLTDLQLFSQGVTLYQNTQYAQALAVLRDVDPMQLNGQQRVLLYQTLQDIDRRLSAAAQADADAASIESIEPAEVSIPDVGALPAQVIETPVEAAPSAAAQDVTPPAQPTLLGAVEVIPVQPRSVDAPRTDASASETLTTVAEVSDAGPAQADDLLARMRVVYAQQKVAEAQAAEREGQYRLAEELYQQALSLDPSSQAASAGRTAAAAKAQQMSAPASLLEQQQFNRSLGAEMTMAEFRQAMNQAAEQLKARNFAAASEQVAQAKVLLDRNQRFVPVSQYKQLREQAVMLGAKIADEEQLARAELEEQIIKQREKDSEQRRLEAITQTDRDVQRLLRRALDLQRELKYDEALQILDQALFLDPNNPATQMMKETIEDNRIYVQYRKLERQRGLQRAELSIQNYDATIPITELVTYPSDWPVLTARRLSAVDRFAGESEINRRVAGQLKQTIPVNFESARFDRVITYLRNTTGLSFYVNWAALAEVGVEPDMPVTLQLENVSVERALDLILDQVSVFSPIDPVESSVIDGIVTISTRSNLTRATEIRTYDIRDLLVRVPSFTEAPEFDLSSILSDEEGFSVESTDEEELPDREELVANITDLIQETVGRQDEWAAFGGSQSSLRELDGNLIVRTTPQNHRALIDLLGQLRESNAMQIHVEGRFLLVDHNFLEEVGIDVDVAYDLADPWSGIGFAQQSAAIASKSAIENTGINGSFSDPEALVDPVTFARQRAMSFSFGYMDDLQLSVVVNATQANRRALSLTAPRITFLNGQRAYVVVATQTSFVSELDAVSDTGGFDQTLDVVNSGVILDVEGTVSADRRYVTLTLRPSLGTLARLRTLTQTSFITGTDPQGNQQILGTSTADLELPELEVTQVKTTVHVPDRGTLLLGGQRLVADVEVRAGVPVLSKVPILNRLFTNETEIKDERTLLILVKPTIIIQDEMEEELYPGLLSDPQQYNLGQTF